MNKFYPIELSFTSSYTSSPEIPLLVVNVSYFQGIGWQVIASYRSLGYDQTANNIKFDHHLSSGFFFNPGDWDYIKNIRDFPVFLFINGQKIQLSPGEAHYIRGKTLALFPDVGSWSDFIFISEAEAGEDRYTRYGS